MDRPPEWLTDPTYRNVYETTVNQHRPDIPYHDWLDHWCGRAVRSQFYPWFDDLPRDIFRPAMANGYAYRLFSNSKCDLEYYHDDQIGAGLRSMIDNDGIHLSHPAVPIEDREACLLAITSMFQDLFAARCAPFMSNGSNEPHLLNGCCYMWWENLTHIAYPGDPNFGRLKDACFKVMEDTLAIPHIAVQEAALHGLGHQARQSDRARAIIQRYLSEANDLEPQLEAYARAALTGCIQ